MLDNLREESGSVAVHELRESFDVSDTADDAIFPDDEVPQMRADVRRLESLIGRLAKRVFAALSLRLILLPAVIASPVGIATNTLATQSFASRELPPHWCWK